MFFVFFYVSVQHWILVLNKYIKHSFVYVYHLPRQYHTKYSSWFQQYRGLYGLDPSTGFLFSVKIQEFIYSFGFFHFPYIIIIMSCCRHGYPWPSLGTSPYRSSTLAGLQDYTPYPHIAAACMFELVVLLLLGHMWGSIGVHHLWIYYHCSQVYSDPDSVQSMSQVEQTVCKQMTDVKWLLYSNSWNHLTIFTNPSARAGYDTRSIFKWSLTG